mgnify:CR=1 FL=1
MWATRSRSETSATGAGSVLHVHSVPNTLLGEHFADRGALIQAAVELWERTRTESVIADVEGVTDGRERLRRLFTTAFTNPRGGRIEVTADFTPSASLMIAAGVNAKALCSYMGHASVSITFDRYGHLMPGNEQEAAGRLDAYLAAAGAHSGAHPS